MHLFKALLFSTLVLQMQLSSSSTHSYSWVMNPDFYNPFLEKGLGMSNYIPNIWYDMGICCTALHLFLSQKYLGEPCWEWGGAAWQLLLLPSLPALWNQLLLPLTGFEQKATTASDVMLSPLNSGFGQKAATEVVCYCSTVNYQLETPRQPLGLEIDNAQCFEMCYVIHASVQCKFPMVDHCLARVSCVVPKKLGWEEWEGVDVFLA